MLIACETEKNRVKALHEPLGLRIVIIERLQIDTSRTVNEIRALLIKLLLLPGNESAEEAFNTKKR